MNHFTAIGVPLYAIEDASDLFQPLLESANPLESTVVERLQKKQE